MKKLPKKHEAGRDTVPVTIEGKEYEAANLYVSAILHQTKVLLDIDDSWREIDCRQLGLDNSDLDSFKRFVEATKLELADLGVFQYVAPAKDYSLKPEHIDELAIKFPAFSVSDIVKLRDWELTNKSHVGVYSLNRDLAMLTERGLTIDQWIADIDKLKINIINGGNTTKTETMVRNDEGKVSTFDPTNPEHLEKKLARIESLTSSGLVFNPQNGEFSGNGFTVTHYSLEMDTDDEWQALMDRINVSAAPVAPEVPAAPSEASNGTYPGTQEGEDDLAGAVASFRADHPETAPAEPVAAATTKPPVSIEIFGKMGPDRIAELHGLKDKQLEVVKANPFVKVTDAKTLKSAKTAKAALLKASTGTEKIEGDATKYLNSFKKMLKDFITPLAKITRDAHEKQQKEIEDYENAEAIRVQNERKAILEKINNRTTQLFEVPFVFNGTIYSIGTVYVTPSQIETATDEEFEGLLNQGRLAKSTLDAERAAQEEKDAKIAELQAKIAAMTGTPATPVQPAAPATVMEAADMIDKVMPPETNSAAPPAPNVIEKTAPETAPAPVTPSPVVNTPAAAVAVPFKRIPETEFIPAPDGNAILSKFDMDHLELISKSPIPPAFIKCRAYYKMGMKDLAAEINNIMAQPVQEGVKKSDLINNLVAIVLKPE